MSHDLFLCSVGYFKYSPYSATLHLEFERSIDSPTLRPEARLTRAILHHTQSPPKARMLLLKRIHTGFATVRPCVYGSVVDSDPKWLSDEALSA